jgi:pyruvate/2-oxoglutarate dehydrogenase complex dihydrolipoamide dehydrogenase (E3) component
VPPIDGLEDAGFLTNETVFSLTSKPARLIVIGGGPIGCELAQAFQRLGSEVTIITDDRLLPRDEPQAAELVTKQFRAEGIRVVTGARVIRVQALETTLPGDGTATDNQSLCAKRVRFERQGEAGNVEGDELLVAAGRQPNVEELGLEPAGVTYEIERGVVVTDRLRTTNPRVYAAGDVCSGLRFTHAAEAQARLVLQNALFFGRARQSALITPWCTYTDPEVAHVGVPANEAAANGTFRELVVELDSIDRNVVDGNTTGYGRISYDRKGRIRSATIVGHGAGNLISEVTLAMTHRLTLGQIASTVHPYPTQGELVKRLGDAYNRKRLTPTVKRLLEGFFACFR